MRKAELPHSQRWNAALFLIALLVITIDQLSKIWIRSNLAYGQSLPATGFFRLTHIHNTGAAFGLLPEQKILLIIAALIGTAVILVLAFFFSPHFPFLDNRLGKLSLGLLLGGTIGNLIDRVRFGYVTDFIDLSIWPAFNVADSAITIGVILIAYSILFKSHTKQLQHG